MPNTLDLSNCTYVPTEWFDNTAPAINAANLNKMEMGIKTAHDCINELNTIVQNLQSQLDSHTHPISDITNLQTELDRCPKGSWSRTDDTLTIDIEGS